MVERKACNMFNVLNENESMIREWNADEGTDLKDGIQRLNFEKERKHSITYSEFQI